MEQWNLDQPITAFLDELASKSSAPGGGSAAALSGAMGAALLSMVCRLTIGRPRYAAAEAVMQTMLDRAEALRHELQSLAEEDVFAFKRLSAAYKLPRVTDADTAIRRDAIQAALRRATEVPLRTARAALGLLPLCQPVIEQGNPSAVSDVGAGIYLAHAATEAALLNVDINLRALEDQRYVREVRAEVGRLTDGLGTEVERLVGLVQMKMAG
ncbi:MAG: cyclodeaminase/cyclohydrolase family protein [Herpetosiphonaceae bacterium]|nr:cyclodeaminase/cyclohydrolase family protein [Herpetosiphonaceae bacterium]